MAWVYLFIAGVSEVVWATFMKESHSFTRLMPSAVTVVFMIVSFYFLALAMRTLPLGTAYTIWTGIGAVGAFIIGLVVYHEPATMLRMIAAILIVSGLVLMKLASPS